MIIRFWKPRKTRYKSSFKKLNKVELKEKKSINLVYGELGIKALESCYLTYNQLESVRRRITRVMKKSVKVIVKIRPETLLTKKGIGVRMGKGKGKESEWICKVREGVVILELQVLKGGLIKGIKALKSGCKKLPMKCKIETYKI